MSVAYQSWEVASGPIVGFNMAIQGNLCATADTLIPETSNYSSNTILSHESSMKAVAAGADMSKGFTFPNHKALTPHDTVIRGLTSLSLHPKSPCEDRGIFPSCESSKNSLEWNCNAPFVSNGKNFCCFAAHSAGYHMQGGVSNLEKPAHDDSSGFKGFEDVACGDSALQPHLNCSDVQGAISPKTFWVATRNYLPLCDNYGDYEFYNFPKHTLDVVVEDKPFEVNLMVTRNDDLEHDALSASSTNSVSSMDSLIDGSVSLGGGLNEVEESEAQSAFKESSTFIGGSPAPRKGLSRFYAGKSRSFSCLGDAMSLRDLAKPENPYAKRRRCNGGRSLNAGRPQLPPLQKGAASISKKPLHNGKSTLALAVTMSTRYDDQAFPGLQRCQQTSPLTSRSYSLSDLQKATESRISLC